ncbi:MAG TPA: carboxyltransferase domain-containing protein [Acidimicrobiales bacterium]|nr:carboxyltransferase domain-containing protein [Acidimicrobiales bacterium]
MPARWRPAGRRAALVEATDPAVTAADIRATASVAGARLVEVVPGASTVLAVAASAADLDRLAALLPELPPRVRQRPGGRPAAVELDVAYDGDDLAEVAARTGLAVDEVVALHAGATFTARFTGFAPGFAYLDGLPPALRLPRRPSPRPVVPAGAVAVADRWSAVYPSASPGGWHLLGRTSATLFDPAADPPALLVPGTRVRFRPVDALPAPPPGRPPPPVAAGGDRLVVVDPGGVALVQDVGRPGHGHLGVPPSGWLDPAAAALANRLVGGAGDEAVLELVGRGPLLRLEASSSRAVVAVAAAAGALPTVAVGGAPGRPGPLEVAPGAEVRVAAAGQRCYVAVSGGLAAGAVLGSRATDTLSGLGPPPCAAGTTLALGVDTRRRPSVDAVPLHRRLPPPGAPMSLRLRFGPRDDWLADGAGDQLLGEVWRVGSASNRVGLRLEGTPLGRRPGELDPEGAVTGSLQLPPTGLPVLFLADHPVTGGYPVVAVVDDDDLPLAGALLPGMPVRFRAAR